MVQKSVKLIIWFTLTLTFSTAIAYRIDQCDWDIYICDKPYNVEKTIHFECRDYDDCPRNFICCSHRCFRHKICQPTKETRDTPTPSSNNVEERPGECDISINCDTSLPKEFTKAFECFHDDDCPSYYKCCFIDCFNHKVCQKAKHIKPQTKSSTVSTVLTTKTESTEIIPDTTTENLFTTSDIETTEAWATNSRTRSVEMEISSTDSEVTTVPLTTTEEMVTVSISSSSFKTAATTEITAPPLVNSMLSLETSTTATIINTISKIPEPTPALGRLETTPEGVQEHPNLPTMVMEIDDLEASGDLETIGDDEDVVVKITQTGSFVISTRPNPKIDYDGSKIQTIDMTTEINDFEGSGDFDMVGDDEDSTEESINKSTDFNSPETNGDFEIDEYDEVNGKERNNDITPKNASTLALEISTTATIIRLETTMELLYTDAVGISNLSLVPDMSKSTRTFSKEHPDLTTRTTIATEADEMDTSGNRTTESNIETDDLESTTDENVGIVMPSTSPIYYTTSISMAETKITIEIDDLEGSADRDTYGDDEDSREIVNINPHEESIQESTDADKLEANGDFVITGDDEEVMGETTQSELFRISTGFSRQQELSTVENNRDGTNISSTLTMYGTTNGHSIETKIIMTQSHGEQTEPTKRINFLEGSGGGNMVGDDEDSTEIVNKIIHTKLFDGKLQTLTEPKNLEARGDFATIVDDEDFDENRDFDITAS